MAAGWVTADVTEAAIERDDETAGSCRSCRDGRIVGTGEAFVDNRVDVVAESLEDTSDSSWQILVELDLHPAETAGYSSRASSAP